MTDRDFFFLISGVIMGVSGLATVMAILTGRAARSYNKDNNE